MSTDLDYLAANYDLWVIRWWKTKHVPALRAEHGHACSHLEVARKRMVEATRRGPG